jgi:hypothetical protein
MKSQDDLRKAEQDFQSPTPSENKYLELNFQREIIKKKHMLDLMMQKKMNRRKKKIIKVYGKDMLAEMYLDLLNINEGEVIPKRLLSPLAGKVPKNFKTGGRNKKSRWNNNSTIPVQDSRNFKLNGGSMFNSPNDKKLSMNKSRSRSKKVMPTNRKDKRNEVLSEDEPSNTKIEGSSKDVKRIRTTKLKKRIDETSNFCLLIVYSILSTS